MYDVQTILSAYDKQGTLVQWLKNLDNVLKESGLETVEATEVENGVKLLFKFAGGTTIESPVIENLQKLDLLADSVQLAYESENGVVVEYNANITANNKGINGTINVLLPIKGSESVVVDVSEDNTTIQIHLDAEVLQKINRSLQIPVGTIPATELVAVTTSKEQKMLTVGTGLKLENDTLSAEATGSGLKVVNITANALATSGTLTSEQMQEILDNYPNVVVAINWVGTVNQIDAYIPAVKVSDAPASVNFINSETGKIMICISNRWELQDVTSSGGLTKTKVTFAELQAMCTIQNIGALVCFVPKSIEVFNLAFTGTICDLSFLGEPVIGVYKNFLFATDTQLGNPNGSVNILSSFIAITNFEVGALDSKEIVLTQNSVIVSEISTDLGLYFNDTYFDFYIYK